MKPAAPILPGLLLSLLLLASAASGGTPPTPVFTDIAAGFPGLFEASMAWGDYDNDEDLDLAVIGRSAAGPLTRIYRNTAGVFADAGALPAAAIGQNGGLAWGDYDRDDDLDLAIAGEASTGGLRFARIFRNDAGSFVDAGAVLEGLSAAGVAWADADNDGDLDLAMAGNNGTAGVAHLYRNDAGAFANAGANLTGARSACVAWGDYDVDGDHDLVIGGTSPASVPTTTLYQNTAGTLSAVAAGLPGITQGSAAWGDGDGDGDPDLLISGNGLARCMQNTGGSFASVGSLESVRMSSAVWGDVDNDGFVDVALGGFTGSIGFGAAYHNEDGTGFLATGDFPNLFDAELAWGDFDGDGDLDLASAGTLHPGFTASQRIYAVSGVPLNSPPAAPTGLTATVGSTTVTFQWNAATDAQGAGLTYNLWAGTAAGTADVLAPMSDLATGFRRVAQPGNVGHNLSWTLPLALFPGGEYFWGVQAVDPAYAGSPFAAPPTVGVESPAGTFFALRLAGPNPSRSSAQIAYVLPAAMRVDLAIYDVHGRRVQTLSRDWQSAGAHAARWTGEAADGSHPGSGVYFVRLSAGGQVATIKIARTE